MLFMFAILASSGAPLRGVRAVPTYNVTIVDYSFRPQIINITTGTNVIWIFATNGSDVNDMHTVTSSNQTQSGSPIFASQILHSGQMFNFTFYSPGHYPYFCSVHPFRMTALVDVTGPPIVPPHPSQNPPPTPLLLYAGIGGTVVAGAVGVSLYRRKTRRISRPRSRL